MSDAVLATIRVGAGGARIQTGRRLRASSPPDPWGEMRIYVPSKEGLRDVFVLEGRPSQFDDPPYRVEKDVSLAEQTVRPAGKLSRDSAPAPYFTLFFDWSDGTDKAWTDPEVDGWTFTLRHRPDGTERSERIVFEGKSRAAVFNGSGDRDRYAEQDPFMHTFVGLRVGLSDGVQVDPRAADGLGYPTGTELHGPRLRETDPLGVSVVAEPPPPPTTDAERREAYREELTSPPVKGGRVHSGSGEGAARAVPIGTRADRTRTWEAGHPVPPSLAEPSDGAPGPVAQARAAVGDTETWVTLIAVRASSPRPSSGRVVYGLHKAERLGTWKATPGGYDFAHYPGGIGVDSPPPLGEAGALDVETLPEPSGAAAPYILVDAGLVLTPRETVFAHVSPYPLPLGRLRRLAADAAREEAPDAPRPGPLTPLYFGTSASNIVGNLRFRPTSAHGDYDDSSWVLYVPDPVRALLRLAEHVEREVSRYQAWTETTGPASNHAAVVESAVFDGARARDYVDDVLAAAPPVGSSWGTFDPSEMVRSPLPERTAPEGTSLGAFQTGHRYAEAYLRHRMDVAASRLEALVSRGPHLTFLEDTYTATVALEMPEAYASLAARVAEATALADGAMCAAGGGGVVLARRLADPTLVEALGADPEACASAVASMEINEGARWQDVLGLARGAREWRLLWSFGVRSVKAGVAYFGSFSQMTALAAASPSGAQTAAAASAVVLNRLAGAPAAYADGPMRRVGGLELRRRTATLASGRELAFWGIELGEAGETRLRAFSRTVRTANVVYLSVAAGATLSREEEFTYRDLASVGKLLGEAAALYRDSERSGGALARAGGAVGRRALSPEVRALVRRAGRALAWAPVRIDAVVTGIEVVGQFVEAPHVGAQAPVRPDLAGALGALCKGVGLSLISVAALAMVAQQSVSALVAGIVAWKVALIGAVLFGIGLFVAWLAALWERRYRERFDPLMEWVPQSSVWGGRALPGTRRALLDMVQPAYLLSASAEWDGESGDPSGRPLYTDEMHQQTEAFVDAAYVFPTTYEVEPVPGANLGGPQRRLTLTIRPLYIRPSGSIPVQVRFGADVLNSRRAEFVVHYAWTGRFSRSKFRYAVANDGDAIDLGPNESMEDEAKTSGWAHSAPVEIMSRGATLEGDGLRVYLGVWETRGPNELRDAEFDLARAQNALDRSRRTLSRAERVWDEVKGRVGASVRDYHSGHRAVDEATAEVAAAERDREEARVALEAVLAKPEPRAVVALGPGGQRALDAAGVGITGGAYFDPAAWVTDPAAVPAVHPDGEPVSIHVAYQRFEGTERR